MCDPKRNRFGSRMWRCSRFPIARMPKTDAHLTLLVILSGFAHRNVRSSPNNYRAERPDRSSACYPKQPKTGYDQNGLNQLIQQRFRVLQVGGLETLGEPVVNREKHFVCRLPLPRYAEQPREQNCGAEKAPPLPRRTPAPLTRIQPLPPKFAPVSVDTTSLSKTIVYEKSIVASCGDAASLLRPSAASTSMKVSL